MTDDLTLNDLIYPKELSWLGFNERVLQEAEDKSSPIIERLRFLGIYSNNMDEFYRVRVANLRRSILIEKNRDDQEAVKYFESLMQQVNEKIAVMTKRLEATYQKTVRELKQHNIELIEPHQLNLSQVEWLNNFFKREVLIHIAPILIDKKVDLVSRLNDSAAYMFISLDRTEKQPKLATVEIPTDKISRFVILPKQGKMKQIILLEDVISIFVDTIFKGFVQYDSFRSYSFKMTRDSEYSLGDGIDDSYLDKMSDSMKQRLIAEPVRVIYDGEMPKDMLAALKKHLKHSSYDNLVAAGKVRNVKDFIKFPNIGRTNLENKAIPAIVSQQFNKHETVFKAISAQDILLYYPYHSFIHFTEFVRQAAFDPRVKHIRISLYRVASNSRIISSLIDAVDNGKSVTVVVELRARFDEEANIAWAKTLTDAGVVVLVGNPAFKIHTKLCLVSREEKGNLVHYAHVGTGNFNENTAKFYTDFSLFTKDQDIGNEVLSVFELIQLPYKQQKFNHLLVSPLNNKSTLLKWIDNETEMAKTGHNAEILLKVNNLVDHDLVQRLYKASQHGVKIRGIVRGMCSLRPGIKGVSDNITLVSVVDRFLEHARVVIFHNNGDTKAYISSADWMKRNMEDRVEVGVPIYSERLIEQIKTILEWQFKDTTKARLLDKDQLNRYVKRGNRRKIRSQLEIYHYLKGQEKLEIEPNN
ncbi:MAG: polyphosphate kinase 1 [Gammaproteobacteria bacterium]|nr:polyphosphate kinase 1 [Gammaproteobacteria bacterium]